MAAQQQKTSAALARPTYTWPRDMVDFMNSFWGDLDWPRRAFASAEGALRIEETIEDDALTVRAEIPGIDPDKDVDISVDDGFLSISATRESKTKQAKDGMFRSEFRYGRFVRQVQVPKNADLDALSATYADGVIEIRIPLKTEEASSARKITVSRS